MINLKYRSSRRLHWTRRIYRRANSVISPIAFSFTMDDFAVVEGALTPQAGDRILTLASAGDTPLNLLRFQPAEIIAVDIAPPQLHLTKLKIAGARELTLSDFRRLIGVSPPGDADVIYQKVRGLLEPETQSFWDDHLDLLRRGIIWQGSVRRMSTFWGPLARLRVRLFRPGLTVADNPYLAPLLLGRMPPEEHLPPYLTESGYPVVQRHLDRLTVVHSDIREFLRQQPASTIDVFALSNVTDWLPRGQQSDFLELVVRAARPGARVLICGHRRVAEVPVHLRGQLVPDRDLQTEVRRADRVGYFRRICVLRVQPGAAQDERRGRG